MVNVQLGTYISQSCTYANVSTLNKCTLWVVYLAAHLYCQKLQERFCSPNIQHLPSCAGACKCQPML